MERPTVGSTTVGVPTSWRFKFTFSNRGDRVARVSNSSIHLLLEGPVDNIRADHRAFGPSGLNDFLVKPGDPIMGVAIVSIHPKTAAYNWEKEYASAYQNGKMKISASIHYETSDELLKSKVPHDLTISIIPEKQARGQQPLTPVECTTIARQWVQSQLTKLNLRNWTDRFNEGDMMVQVIGTVNDEYLIQHEFDVRVRRADGTIQNGSYVK